MASDIGPPPVTPEEYRTLIQGLDISSVWLAKCVIENEAGPGVFSAEIGVRSDASSWRSCDDGFEALVDYFVRVTGRDGVVFGRIGVTFGFRYKSAIAMNDRLFSAFQQNNLPVNSWPYLRQFLADASGRMGWLPFTLPALKRVAPSQPDKQ